MFNDFIKHYNIIRVILRDIFLYGCFSREDLCNKRNLSSRKISYEIRRIQQYVEEAFVKSDRDGRNKLLALTYDSIRNTENFLVKTYMTKSFTPTDLILYFNILMFLNSRNEQRCFNEIEEHLIGEGLISYDNISSKTIERKLNEMCKNVGILKCETLKRTKYYGISEDVFKDLDNNEIEELSIAVALFKNISFPVTAGYYCEQSLKDYAKYERELNIETKDIFQYKNLHFHPVIEEQVLCKILNAIYEKKQIKIHYNLPMVKRKSGTNQCLRPYKIRYDINCGRFYLVSYDSNNRCLVSRLDRIDDIEVCKDKYEREKLKKLYERDMKYSWSSVPLAQGKKPENIVLEIHIDESKENYIIETIRSEAREGVIERLREGVYRLTMVVNDSSEMVPWIRRYSGYVKIIQGRGLINKINEDWKEMLDNYGTF